MKRNRARGFSLMELMVALSLGALVLTMGFSGLNKARTSGGSRGLANAVTGEFLLAREKAIAKGSPVAVVIPGDISQTLFFLEGETSPSVTRTVDYSGDYPYGAIAVAQYPGPTFGNSPEEPGSKAIAWKNRLDEWLPDEYAEHKTFMFIPNGSVVTKNVLATDGAYHVVVGMGAEVDGGVLRAVGEPETIVLASSGAVEQFGRLLGHTGGVRTEGASLPSSLPAAVSPKAPSPLPANIEKPVVTPEAELVEGRLAHVLDKGEYLTLELFAKSQDGRSLYVSWVSNPQTKSGDEFKGAFSVPGAARERMEFYPEFDISGDGEIQAPKEINVWRSVWTWTPPAIAEAGDRYSLDVAVTDAEGNVKAELTKEEPILISPPGEIVFESNRSGRWQLFMMKSDGKDVRRLTEGNHDYRCASVTADGKMIAFQRDNEVWVMNIDKTGQTKVGNGYLPCISPTGGAIAFMQNGGPSGAKVVVKRLDGASGAIEFPTVITTVAGAPTPSNRLAFSANGDWIYYTKAVQVPGGAWTGPAVRGTRLNYAGAGLSDDGHTDAAVSANQNVAAVGGIFASRQGSVYYHDDGPDPFIGKSGASDSGQLNPSDTTLFRKSVGTFEAYPAISPYSDLMLYCKEVGGSYQIFSVPEGGWSDVNSGTQLTNSGENLRPAWIRQEKAH